MYQYIAYTFFNLYQFIVNLVYHYSLDENKDKEEKLIVHCEGCCSIPFYAKCLLRH